jgi:anthranilate synthase component 2
MPVKIGIIDNYDSFTYNLVHYLEEITGNIPFVWLNDQINWDILETCTLVLSPGPGLPAASGSLMEVIKKFHLQKNILGVCLGMQAIGEFFGAKIRNLDKVQHGMQTEIFIEAPGKDHLYKGMASTITVGRYHSWVVDEEGLPKELIVTARDEKDSLMSFQHSTLPIYGVQYHPESIMTADGKKILRNWLGI